MCIALAFASGVDKVFLISLFFICSAFTSGSDNHFFPTLFFICVALASGSDTHFFFYSIVFSLCLLLHLVLMV